MSEKRRKAEPLTRDRVREIAAKYGIGELPRDHPIYGEGPSLTFRNRSVETTKAPDFQGLAVKTGFMDPNVDCIDVFKFRNYTKND